MYHPKLTMLAIKKNIGAAAQTLQIEIRTLQVEKVFTYKQLVQKHPAFFLEAGRLALKKILRLVHPLPGRDSAGYALLSVLVVCNFLSFPVNGLPVTAVLSHLLSHSSV